MNSTDLDSKNYYGLVHFLVAFNEFVAAHLILPDSVDVIVEFPKIVKIFGIFMGSPGTFVAQFCPFRERGQCSFTS